MRPGLPCPGELGKIMDEMVEITRAPASNRASSERLHELDVRLARLLDASASRCRELADRLALVEEHSVRRSLPTGLTAARAATLAQKLDSASVTPRRPHDG